MKILICNVGSTSLKYQLFDMDDKERVLASGKAERVGGAVSSFSHKSEGGSARAEELHFPTHREAIEHMLLRLKETAVSSLEEISCVGFKVVHAQGVTGVQYLDERVLSAMAAFNAIAPAHNPPYIAAIRQFRALLPQTPLIGSFETGFHASMPPEAYLYSIPSELTKKYGIRRYGFHGASHEYVSGYVSRAMGRTDVKLVSCHLGGSGSLCAVKNGRSVDTTLGFSLQSGIMHNNRCGDIDPYITFYLSEVQGMTLPQIREIYEKKSGFFGMSGGVSNDLRDIEDAAAAGNEDAKNAIESYCYQIKKLIGAYAAAMEGLDAVAFAGGIGENSAAVRRKTCARLDFLGLKLDPEKNETAKIGDEIGAADSRVRVFIVGTNEEIVVARKAKELLESPEKIR